MKIKFYQNVNKTILKKWFEESHFNEYEKIVHMHKMDYNAYEITTINKYGDVYKYHINTNACYAFKQRLSTVKIFKPESIAQTVFYEMEV